MSGSGGDAVEAIADSLSISKASASSSQWRRRGPWFGVEPGGLGAWSVPCVRDVTRARLPCTVVSLPTSGLLFRPSLGPAAQVRTVLNPQSPSVGSGVPAPSGPDLVRPFAG